MNILNGDLIEAFKNKHFDVIVHGCNCFCTMGGGIARLIRDEFPDAYRADLKTVSGDKSKLGTYTFVDTEYGRIINGYTQFDYGYGEVHCDYDAIRSLFKKINEEYKGKKIGIPKIGCGLAGGSWEVVEKIINEVAVDIDVTAYYL